MTNFHNGQNLPNVPNTVASLRAAYGPGLQFVGPTEAVLRTVTGPTTRHFS